MNTRTLLTVIVSSTMVFAATAAHAGSVTGSITYSKPAPARKAHNITKDKNVCSKKKLLDEQLIVSSNKGIANVVVSIEGVKKGKKATPGKVIIDQSSCSYIPHVAAATLDSKLTIKNSDSTLHNVHAYLESDTAFNVAMPTKGMTVDRKLEDEGVVQLKCDAGHTWMSAYVLVFDHPNFAVTGADGSFSIDGVPAGKYKVKVWHEKLGEKKGSITVAADGSGAFNFAY